MLRGAGALFVLITGADKRAALERARAPGPVGAAPVRLVLDRARVDWATLRRRPGGRPLPRPGGF
ncbi:MAG: hypothetical protein KatS3mg118_2076 [Paracoccaceae bacterium]|nr:MAG: hypothetical protein KatS3mg118_2076 [Paracoccaceae bacterium]